MNVSELTALRLNESPSQKEGKFFRAALFLASPYASMKALPNRKGNLNLTQPRVYVGVRLNESPSQKEGK